MNPIRPPRIHRLLAQPRDWGMLWSDSSLTALLAAQCFVTFAAVPLAAMNPSLRWLLGLGHLVFALVCTLVLTGHRALRSALVGGLLLLTLGPPLAARFGANSGFGPDQFHLIMAATALLFNLLVTVLTARHTFGPGRVTAHRLQGAVVVYLNVAALFAIAYGLLELYSPGAIRSASGGILSAHPGVLTAELSYFSLTTITSTGYGDLVPVNLFARSLANIEAIFGQLFPATFLARLVALHMMHNEPKSPRDTHPAG